MPTYEFKCPLGHEFEKFEKMSFKGTTKCPTCGKLARRVISGGAGFVFKGSGFYQTDYKNTGAAPKSDVSKSESKAESKTESKSDSKGEAKSEKADKSEKTTKSETKAKKADA
jgi:putative FmdB family regulatory protein